MIIWDKGQDPMNFENGIREGSKVADATFDPTVDQAELTVRVQRACATRGCPNVARSGFDFCRSCYEDIASAEDAVAAASQNADDIESATFRPTEKVLLCAIAMAVLTADSEPWPWTLILALIPFAFAYLIARRIERRNSPRRENNTPPSPRA